jgi:hypothetical protein
LKVIAVPEGVHPHVFKVPSALQPIAPPENPWLAQEALLRLVPSHCSPGSIWPLPGQGPLPSRQRM